MHAHTTQTKQVGVFPCRGWVAPCQRAPGSIKGLPFRCQSRAVMNQVFVQVGQSISTVHVFSATPDQVTGLAWAYCSGRTSHVVWSCDLLTIDGDNDVAHMEPGRLCRHRGRRAGPLRRPAGRPLGRCQPARVG